MRYRGGGVGHSSTREPTNKFLHDRDPLYVPNGDESDEGDIEEDEVEVEHRHQGGSREEDERRPQDTGDVDGEDDVADPGRISGGDKADGGDGFDGDEGDDYGYENHVDDDENSEEEPDLADDALGPEDGEGEGDETYLLGFAAL